MGASAGAGCLEVFVKDLDQQDGLMPRGLAPGKTIWYLRGQQEGNVEELPSLDGTAKGDETTRTMLVDT